MRTVRTIDDLRKILDEATVKGIKNLNFIFINESGNHVKAVYEGLGFDLENKCLDIYLEVEEQREV